MNFLEMVIRLQITYDEKIILISCGAFYIAVGSDAVVLNKELGLKTTCAKTKICKVGVPKSSIDKYKEKLNELGYSYIILDYDKDKRELIKIFELNVQRIFLRIMQKNRWIDNKKFDVSMQMIYEMGKIVGGLVKYYAKDS